MLSYQSFQVLLLIFIFNQSKTDFVYGYSLCFPIWIVNCPSIICWIFHALLIDLQYQTYHKWFPHMWWSVPGRFLLSHKAICLSLKICYIILLTITLLQSLYLFIQDFLIPLYLPWGFGCSCSFLFQIHLY